MIQNKLMRTVFECTYDIESIHHEGTCHSVASETVWGSAHHSVNRHRNIQNCSRLIEKEDMDDWRERGHSEARWEWRKIPHLISVAVEQGTDGILVGVLVLGGDLREDRIYQVFTIRTTAVSNLQLHYALQSFISYFRKNEIFLFLVLMVIIIRFKMRSEK